MIMRLALIAFYKTVVCLEIMTAQKTVKMCRNGNKRLGQYSTRRNKWISGLKGLRLVSVG